jgi:hypothetical protein
MKTNKVAQFFNTERIMLFGIILAKLVLSLLPISYGIFRDEFYYLSMSKRLGLGYVDVPPLPPLILAGTRFLFGDSLFALHLIPALSGVLFLIVTYLLIKKLNGNRFALFLTLTTVLFAPYIVAVDSIYTYDTFNKLCWLYFSFLMIRLIQTEDPKYWIYIGITSGVALLFKITILYLGLGWIIGLLVTKQRKLLFRREVLWAGVLVFIICSPYLLWQIQHGFISLEYYRNYAAGKVSSFSLPGYLLEQVLYMSPLTFPIWLAGLYYLLFHPQGKILYSAGITYLVILLLSYFTKAKPDLIAPYYAILLAAGCLWLGNLLVGGGKRWLQGLQAAVFLLVVISGLAVLPAARPVLPVEKFLKTFVKLSIKKDVEGHTLPNLPQLYADRFGWQEMTRKVAQVYHSLPATDRAKACIVTRNYGEAGAIEYYGEKYHLPSPPVSGHLQYYIWGPGRFSGEVVIAVGFPYDDVKVSYQDVQKGPILTNPYMMPYERANPIYVGRKPLKRFQEIKPWFKWFD